MSDQSLNGNEQMDSDYKIFKSELQCKMKGKRKSHWTD